MLVCLAFEGILYLLWIHREKSNVFRGKDNIMCHKEPGITNPFLSLSQHTLNGVQDTLVLYQIMVCAIENSAVV